MAKQTVLDEVKARMKELQDGKAAQLETIRQKQDEAGAQIEAAKLAMKQATEEMDVDSYEEAKSRKHRAQTALDMYNGRYNQIKQQEYISEADSDKVVNSLLAYEDELAAGFKAAAAEHVKKLAELLRDYMEAVEDVEQTLTGWQRDIHANYNSRGSASYFDEFTGQHTGRSPLPIPVHQIAYTGCTEAAQLGEYLDKARALYAEG